MPAGASGRGSRGPPGGGDGAHFRQPTRQGDVLTVYFPVPADFECCEPGCRRAYTTVNWTSRRQNLQRHLESDHGARILHVRNVCSVCEQTLSARPLQHACLAGLPAQAPAEDRPRHRCELCDSSFPSRQGLANHTRWHQRQAALQAAQAPPVPVGQPVASPGAASPPAPTDPGPAPSTRIATPTTATSTGAPTALSSTPTDDPTRPEELPDFSSPQASTGGASSPASADLTPASSTRMTRTSGTTTSPRASATTPAALVDDHTQSDGLPDASSPEASTGASEAQVGPTQEQRAALLELLNEEITDEQDPASEADSPDVPASGASQPDAVYPESTAGSQSTTTTTASQQEDDWPLRELTNELITLGRAPVTNQIWAQVEDALDRATALDAENRTRRKSTGYLGNNNVRSALFGGRFRMVHHQVDGRVTLNGDVEGDFRATRYPTEVGLDRGAKRLSCPGSLGLDPEYMRFTCGDVTLTSNRSSDGYSKPVLHYRIGAAAATAAAVHPADLRWRLHPLRVPLDLDPATSHPIVPTAAPNNNPVRAGQMVTLLFPLPKVLRCTEDDCRSLPSTGRREYSRSLDTLSRTTASRSWKGDIYTRCDSVLTSRPTTHACLSGGAVEETTSHARHRCDRCPASFPSARGLVNHRLWHRDRDARLATRGTTTTTQRAPRLASVSTSSQAASPDRRDRVDANAAPVATASNSSTPQNETAESTSDAPPATPPPASSSPTAPSPGPARHDPAASLDARADDNRSRTSLIAETHPDLLGDLTATLRHLLAEAPTASTWRTCEDSWSRAVALVSAASVVYHVSDATRCRSALVLCRSSEAIMSSAASARAFTASGERLL
ncbi:hypothetical protein HPB50_008247 [Hyalomma asiaticum]|uniref:Uncharacterized protein n=1 Tax=Hyalomma asiaticum TaxID=266040 RepID=A0ACB7T6H3_HYAAI|nr:hypothetical protein HPB50_008247 [Hyalomma asiaticum]